MNKARPANATPPKDAKPRRRGDQRESPELQPAPTGANTGSPAARVMKQFAKTKTESTGRS